MRDLDYYARSKSLILVCVVAYAVGFGFATEFKFSFSRPASLVDIVKQKVTTYFDNIEGSLAFLRQSVTQPETIQPMLAGTLATPTPQPSPEPSVAPSHLYALYSVNPSGKITKVSDLDENTSEINFGSGSAFVSFRSPNWLYYLTPKGVLAAINNATGNSQDLVAFHSPNQTGYDKTLVDVKQFAELPKQVFTLTTTLSNDDMTFTLTKYESLAEGQQTRQQIASLPGSMMTGMEIISYLPSSGELLVRESSGDGDCSYQQYWRIKTDGTGQQKAYEKTFCSTQPGEIGLYVTGTTLYSASQELTPDTNQFNTIKFFKQDLISGSRQELPLPSLEKLQLPYRGMGDRIVFADPEHKKQSVFDPQTETYQEVTWDYDTMNNSEIFFNLEDPNQSQYILEMSADQNRYTLINRLTQAKTEFATALKLNPRAQKIRVLQIDDQQNLYFIGPPTLTDEEYAAVTGSPAPTASPTASGSPTPVASPAGSPQP